VRDAAALYDGTVMSEQEDDFATLFEASVKARS